MNNSNNTWIIGGAVVVAGLLIAAGVFFGESSTESQAEDLAIAGAEAAEVDTEAFQSCLSSDQFQDVIQADVADANANGGSGTPYNVLLFADPLSEETQSQLTGMMGSNATLSEDGKRLALSGAVPYNAMTQIVDAALADPESEGEAATSSELAIAPVDEEDHIRGERDAEVVLVEYSDLRCPYCAQFHETMKQVVDNYEGSEIAWVYRHLPIPQLHPQAPRLAQAAECAADAGGEEAFWSFTDYIFAQN